MRKPGGAFVVALLSCGAPQHGTSSDAVPPAMVKTYAPLGIKADAKAPRQSVILGTDTRGGSTVLPLPGVPARATVDAMFARAGAGALIAIELATAPHADGSAQVGVPDAPWRAAVWTGAIVAATALDKDLGDFTFSASSAGTVDATAPAVDGIAPPFAGAAVSGLLAGGFVAAITGAPIDPHATLAGWLDPDGTIGPVAGLPEAFLAAIDKGKKRLGYPSGMRLAKSAATGKLVDLEELAKQHGAEAIELADVRGAYHLLTNRTLPETVPVAEADMALDAAQTQLLEARYADQKRELATKWATIIELDSAGRIPTSLRTVRDRAQHYVASAEQLHKQHLVAAASTSLAAANAFASATTDTSELLARLRAADLAGARAQLDALGARARDALGVFQEIGAVEPVTLDRHVTAIAAFEAAIGSWSYERFADDALAAARVELDGLAGKSAAELGSPQLAEQVGNRFVVATLAVARTVQGSELARAQLVLAAKDSVGYSAPLASLRRIASSYDAASAAELDEVETSVVQRSAGSAEDARAVFAAIDGTYVVASRAASWPRAAGVPRQLAATWGEQSLPWALVSLAAGELGYVSSAQLVARYVSLGVRVDGTPITDASAPDAAFASLFANAERAARANARAALIATGAIPVPAKLAYQRAIAERGEDAEARWSALAELWQSSAMSQTAVMFARN